MDYARYTQRQEQLKAILEKNETAKTIELVSAPESYMEAEGFVHRILGNTNSPPELIEATLNGFYKSRRSAQRDHGGWVHSLSHITSKLWERRLLGWIKMFNEAAFLGAAETGDYNCSDRLVNDFARYSQWQDDPAEVHLMTSKITWLELSKHNRYAIERVAAGKFKTEQDGLRWELRQTYNMETFDYDAQRYLVDTDRVRSLTNRLKELGEDVSEFNHLLRELLTTQLKDLESKLKAATMDWELVRLEKGLAKTRTALASL